MSPSPLPKLTDAEFEIMGIVWEEGETSVNHVWETINRKRQTQLSRTTILVQMTRLEEKKWLKHRTMGRTFLYYPTRKKDETLESLVGDIHR
jgi:predicted transcriptional regulator